MVGEETFKFRRGHEGGGASSYIYGGDIFPFNFLAAVFKFSKNSINKRVPVKCTGVSNAIETAINAFSTAYRHVDVYSTSVIV